MDSSLPAAGNEREHFETGRWRLEHGRDWRHDETMDVLCSSVKEECKEEWKSSHCLVPLCFKTALTALGIVVPRIRRDQQLESIVPLWGASEKGWAALPKGQRWLKAHGVELIGLSWKAQLDQGVYDSDTVICELWDWMANPVHPFQCHFLWWEVWENCPRKIQPNTSTHANRLEIAFGSSLLCPVRDTNPSPENGICLDGWAASVCFNAQRWATASYVQIGLKSFEETDRQFFQWPY